MSKLLVNKGTFQLQEVELKPGVITLGRSADNDVQLSDPTVSSRHAKIVTVMKTSYIEDLGSTNGISVNGKRVEKHALRADDVISIGNYEILFRRDKSGLRDHDDTDDATQVIATASKTKASAHQVVRGVAGLSVVKAANQFTRAAEKPQPIRARNASSPTAVKQAPETVPKSEGAFDPRVQAEAMPIAPEKTVKKTAGLSQSPGLHSAASQPQVQAVKNPHRKVIVDSSYYESGQSGGYGENKNYQHSLALKNIVNQIILTDSSGARPRRNHKKLLFATVAVVVLAVFFIFSRL